MAALNPLAQPAAPLPPVGAMPPAGHLPAAPAIFAPPQLYAVPQATFRAEWPQSLDPHARTTNKKILDFMQAAAWWIFLPLTAPVYLMDRLATRMLILPSSSIRSCEAWDERRRVLLNRGGEWISFKTPDNKTIDGIFFRGRNPDKVIIYRGGNGEIYEGISGTRFNSLLNTGASLFLYNPRGVVRSTGIPTPTGVSLDYYSAFEYLVNMKGIDPDNILGHGFSFGGAEVVSGADLVQKKYPLKTIKVISDRSFDHMSSVSLEFGRTIDEYMVPNLAGKYLVSSYWLGNVFLFIPRLIVNYIAVTGYSLKSLWNRKSCSAVLCFIPNLLVTYLAVTAALIGFERMIKCLLRLSIWSKWDIKAAWDRLKNQKCVIFHRADKAVSYRASMHNRIVQEGAQGLIAIELREENHNQEDGYAVHGRNYYPAEAAQVQQVVRNFLNLA